MLGSSEKRPDRVPENAALPAAAINSSSLYREPIEKKDLAASAIPPSKITPQIDGRVINLKDLQ